MPRRSRSRSRSSSPRSPRRSRSRRSRDRSDRSESRDRSRGRSRSRSRSMSRNRHVSPSDIGHRIHIGDLEPDTSERELRRHFEKFGGLLEVWFARRPPCYAFVVFKDKEDAEEAVRETDGRNVCGVRVRVSHAKPRVRGGRRNMFGDSPPRHDRDSRNGSLRCFTCGETGHFARDCYRVSRGGRNDGGRYDGGRYNSRSRSRSVSRSRSRSRSRGRNDRRDRRRRSPSPERHSRKHSPDRRGYAEGSRRRRSSSGERANGRGEEAFE